MHLKQPGFLYSACGPFKRERTQKSKKTRDLRYIYQNNSRKVCSQYDMIYGGFKDLPRITSCDNVLF